MTIMSPERQAPEHEAGRVISKRTLQIVGALVVLGSLGVVVWNAVATSSARVNATTTGSSFFSAGTIDIFQPNLAVELLFDADGLFPGRPTTGCVEVAYQGSIASSVRLHAERLGGTGLEDFIQLDITSIATDGCPEDEPVTGSRVYSGLLADLQSDHPNYSSAIVLDDEMEAGDRLVLFAVAEVVDDNDAQGLTTVFNITLEARP